MSAEIEIVDDKEQSRYEARVDGETAAIADYVKQPGIVSFTHTETFAGHKGQGIAGKVVDREFLELVPEERRGEFGL